MAWRPDWVPHSCPTSGCWSETRPPGQNSAWCPRRSSSFPLDERVRRYQGMMGRVQAADHMPDERTSLLVVRPARPEEHSAVGELVVGPAPVWFALPDPSMLDLLADRVLPAAKTL